MDIGRPVIPTFIETCYDKYSLPIFEKHNKIKPLAINLKMTRNIFKD
jgi:hypothetical protein